MRVRRKVVFIGVTLATAGPTARQPEAKPGLSN